ncbi:MAG TPA: hypothetical protein VGA37_14550 [Gemmatimonadales bacterium]
MALYTKCLTCGGWREIPEDPDAQSKYPTGLMMNADRPPAKLCTCAADGAGGTAL